MVKSLPSLSRTVLILKALERTPLSMKEIAQLTDIPLSSVYRLVKSLNDFVVKEKKYCSLTVKGRLLLSVLANTQIKICLTCKKPRLLTQFNYSEMLCDRCVSKKR